MSAERAGQFSRKKTLQFAGAALEAPLAGGDGGLSSSFAWAASVAGIKPKYMDVTAGTSGSGLIGFKIYKYKVKMRD